VEGVVVADAGTPETCRQEACTTGLWAPLERDRPGPAPVHWSAKCMERVGSNSGRDRKAMSAVFRDHWQETPTVWDRRRDTSFWGKPCLGVRGKREKWLQVAGSPQLWPCSHLLRGRRALSLSQLTSLCCAVSDRPRARTISPLRA
jgi:hypothetical protein